MVVICGMRWERESLSLHFYRLKRSLTSHRHLMRGTGLWWCCKLYTWIAAQLNVMAVTGDSYPCCLGHLPSALTNWAISPPPLQFGELVLCFCAKINSHENNIIMCMSSMNRKINLACFPLKYVCFVITDYLRACSFVCGMCKPFC